MTVLDLFAGPGGWDVGAQSLGLDPIGVELDADACATRAAAGLRTIRGSVSDLAPRGEVEGLIASPPCTAFSQAGNRKGIGHLDALRQAIHDGDWSARPSDDPTVWLVLEVGRWAEALQPQWIACEQVKQVLPLWEAYVEWLERHGWYAWAGRVSAEQYGVPQTRERALLLAHRDRPVGPPTPTHQKYMPRQADRGRSGLLLPWVSMADALGWGATERPYPVIASSRTTGGPDKEKVGGSGARRQLYDELDAGRWEITTRGALGDQPGRHDNFDPEAQPARAVVGRPSTWVKREGWTVSGSTQSHAADRAADEPSPTVANGHNAGAMRLHTNRGQDKHGNRQTREGSAPAPALTAKSGGQWKTEEMWPEHRPSTTVVGSFRPDIIAAPGWRKPGDGPRQNAPGSIKVELEDVLVLQSFPADYPLQGSRTSQFRQVGNAVPPLLAKAVLEVLVHP